jgi:hypothetical protein
MMGYSVADGVGGTETIKAGFIGAATGPKGRSYDEDSFGGEVAYLFGELTEGNFMLVEGRDQSARELDLSLTLPQHTPILASCSEVA